MAWLVKSELTGDPLTQEEYEKETLKLPRGMERYASLYETLYYLQDIDLIVILVCKVRNIEIPELFCISHEEAISIGNNRDDDKSYRTLTTFFNDETRKDGFSRRYRFNQSKFPLNDIVSAFFYGDDSQDKKEVVKDFKRIHENILILQQAYASEVLACMDENNKKGYLWFTASFRPCYNKIVSELINPRDAISLITKEKVSFDEKILGIVQDRFPVDDSFLNGKKIPAIILELEKEGQLIRKDKWFTASVSARNLIMGLNEEKKKYIRNIFIEWVFQKSGIPYTDETLNTYFKSESVNS